MNAHNTRDHHVANQRPDWFPPQRVTTPEPRAVASIEAWRTSPAVVREYRRGLLHGWIGAMAFYTVASVLLILAFHALGVTP